MSLLTAATRGVRAFPQLAWQISAVPAQVLTTDGRQDRTGLPFLVAVSATAALGVVDWPVALLVAGGYLLGRRQPSPPALAKHDIQRPPVRATEAALQHKGPTPTTSPPPRTDLDPADPGPVPPVSVPLAPAPPGPVPPVPYGRSAAPKGTGRSHAGSVPAAAGRDRRPPVTPEHSQHAHGGPVDVTVTRVAGPAQERAARDAAGEPWVGYDRMTVPDVLKRLDERGLDLVTVARYERAHRNRKMVQAAITQRRSAAI